MAVQATKKKKPASHLTLGLIRDLIPDPIPSQAPNLLALAPSSMQHLALSSVKLLHVLDQAPVQGLLLVEMRKHVQEERREGEKWEIEGVEEVKGVEGVEGEGECSPLEILEEEVVFYNALGDKDRALLLGHSGR